MLGGGDAVKAQCRTVDIMSDAAYAILTRDSKTFTGNFVIDDEILKQDGCTDFEKYSCVPGQFLVSVGTETILENVSCMITQN